MLFRRAGVVLLAIACAGGLWIPLLPPVLRAGSEPDTDTADRTVVIEGCEVLLVNRSVLASARPGIIAELPFEEGDYVTAGDLVVRLTDEVAVTNLALREAQARIETPIHVAEREADAARLEYEANAKAARLEPDAVPGTTLERLRLVREARDLQVTQAREELQLNRHARDQAQAELDTYRIHTEFSGLVTKSSRHVGEAVNLGDEILEIVDSRRVRVEGKVPYWDSRRIRVGDPVRVQVVFDRGGHPELADREFDIEREVFAGKIGFIGVEASEAFYEVRIWAEVENRDNLLIDRLPARMTVLVSAPPRPAL